MPKTLLPVLILGWLIAACGNSNVPIPTATAVPSPSPAPTMAPPLLINEIDIDTQTGTAYTLDWSPDGDILAVASGYEITLVSRDLSQINTVLKPGVGALAVTWNPDQTKFATVNGYRNRTIRLWDLDAAKQQLTPAQEIEAASDQYGVFWSPDGKLLATLADDDTSTFQIWDVSTGAELHKYELPYAVPLRTSGWSADSTSLYAAGELKGQIVVFALDISDGSVRELAKFAGEQAAVFAFSPDTRKLAIADEHGIVQIVDAISGDMLAQFESVNQPVDVAWNPAGTALAILGYKTELQLWGLSD